MSTDFFIPSLLGCLATIIYLTFKIASLNKEVNYYAEQLKDFRDLLQMRNKKIEYSMLDLTRWSVEQLPEELVSCLFKDSRILELKDKVLIKDEDFYLTFQDALIKLQQVFTQRISTMFLDFTGYTLEGIRSKLNNEIPR